jgi:hypothetical protein
MPAVFVFSKRNATMLYTMMKTPNKVKISKSILESQILNAIAIFARVQKVRRRVQELLEINKSSSISLEIDF